MQKTTSISTESLRASRQPSLNDAVAQAGLRGSASSQAKWRKSVAWVIALYVLEILAAKSWVMELMPENSLLLINYALSALLVGILLYQYSYLGLSSGSSLPVHFMRLVVGGVIGWLSVNLLNRQEPEYEALALAAFALMALFAMELLPSLLRWNMFAKIEGIFSVSFGIWVVLSLGSLVWAPMDIYDLNGRFRGICGNVAVASGIYQTIALWFLSRLIVVSSNWRWWAMAGASVACLLLTKTRGSFTVCLVGTLLGFWLLRKRSYRSELLVLAMLVLAFCGLSYLVIDPTATDALLTYFRFQGDTIDTRTMNWLFGLQRLEGNEWHGLGLLARHTSESTFSSSFGVGRSGYNQLYDPHNAYIYAALVGGYPLACLVACLPLVAIPCLRRAWPKVRDARSHLALFAFLNVVAYLLSTLGSPAYLTLGNFLDRLFWFAVGVIVFCVKAQLPSQVKVLVFAHPLPVGTDQLSPEEDPAMLNTRALTNTVAEVSS